MRKIHLVSLILPALLVCGTAKAQASALEQLLIDKQYPAFVSAAEQAAKQGDAEALFLLGKTYHLGMGVDVDLGRAKNFYRQAADKDSARAWHNLGTIELARNRAEEAIQYLEKALQLGFKTPTESNLGRAYLIEGERIHSTVLLTKAMHYLQQDYAI